MKSFEKDHLTDSVGFLAAQKIEESEDAVEAILEHLKINLIRQITREGSRLIVDPRSVQDSK